MRRLHQQTYIGGTGAGGGAILEGGAVNDDGEEAFSRGDTGDADARVIDGGGHERLESRGSVCFGIVGDSRGRAGALLEVGEDAASCEDRGHVGGAPVGHGGGHGEGACCRETQGE